MKSNQSNTIKCEKRIANICKKAEEKLQTTLETTVNRLLPLQTFLIKAAMSPFHVYSVCTPSLRLESTCLDSISSRPNEAHCSRFRMSHFSRSNGAFIANSDKYTFWHGFFLFSRHFYFDHVFTFQTTRTIDIFRLKKEKSR